MTVNPWNRLPSRAPFILPEDQPAIDSFNSGLRDDDIGRVHLEIHPSPFVGNPEAPVVLLALSPHFNPKTVAKANTDEFIKPSLGNLAHRPVNVECPFFFLGLGLDYPGRLWWQKCLGHLIKAVGQPKVEKNIFCVDYFPYHVPAKFKHGQVRVPSQKYGFSLLKQAMERDAVILFLYKEARRLWSGYDAIPELHDYRRAYEPGSGGDGIIDEINFPQGFPVAVETLQKCCRCDPE